MDVREKLVELIIDAKRGDPETGSFTEYLADHLITNGVTVQEWGQRKAMEEQGWTIEEFRSHFGRNYIMEENADA